MKQRTKWTTAGMIIGIIFTLSAPVYAHFGHGPIHTNGPINGDIADFELVTFEATVDYAQPPMLLVSDEQTVQWTIFTGSLRYWEDQGFNVEAGDALTITGATIVYSMGAGFGGGMHNGGGFTSEGVSQHFVVFSIDNHTTGQSIQFRDMETGAPLWSHFGFQQ